MSSRTYQPSEDSTISGSPLILADRYRCGRILGTGATSVVYAGRDLSTGADVAIKRIARDVSTHRDGGDLLRREVGVANTVSHPGLVQVYDAGAESDGSFYIVMELLEGMTFEDFLARRPDDLEGALDVIEAVLEPLAALHQRGIVHRDIKPSNVFVTQAGQVKLLDLGIAKHSADASVTKTGAGVGTPHYMAPEQAINARSVTPAADVWSIGAMLYRVLTGAVPFDGDGAYEVILKACTEDLPRIADRVRDVDARYVRFVDLCTAKTPELRFADAAQAAVTLKAVRRGAANPFAEAAFANPSLVRSEPRASRGDDATEPAFRDVVVPRSSRVPLVIAMALCALLVVAGAVVVVSSLTAHFAPHASDTVVQAVVDQPVVPVEQVAPDDQDESKELPPEIALEETVIEPRAPAAPKRVERPRKRRSVPVAAPAPEAPLAAEPLVEAPPDEAAAMVPDADEAEPEAREEATPEPADATPEIAPTPDAGVAPVRVAPPPRAPPPKKPTPPKPFLTF